MHFHDQKNYDLYAYCIMSNHVHLVFKILDKVDKHSSSEENKYSVTKIMQSIKSFTALECNKILNRKGAFWKTESYDRVIRNQDELENTIRYTLNNPVKAGLVEYWEKWPFTYCKPDFIKTFSNKNI
ncbi:MAG: transposase [Balneolaceae bacterium]|nr:transposase [Balneolaceae bacterium]